MGPEFIEMDYIRPHTIVKRAYQVNIFNAVKDRNALVVVPTGLGKTVIAFMVIAHRIPHGKVLFLAPTKPLCEQHHASLLKLTTLDDVFLITGEKTKKGEREEIYRRAQAIVATPQTIANDLNEIDMGEFSLVIFDEAHRAVGNYAYVPIAEECVLHGVQILGLTASPRSDAARLKEVITHLGIEAIEVRTEDDPDVKPYLPPRIIRWKMIDMPPEMKAMAARIEALKADFLIELNKYYKLPTSPKRVTKKMLIDAQKKLQQRLAKGGKSLYGAVSVVSTLIKVYHLSDMLTSQGVEAAKTYLKKIEKDTSKAAKRLRKNAHYQEVKRALAYVELSNPKLVFTREIVGRHFAKKRDARVMVFAEYRDTIDVLFNELNRMPGVRAAKFIGQAKGSGDGMSQDEQKKVIQAFRDGAYNVLISTSIGEEGIDIPATSLVLFYEPVPSAIRHIQRRGRTARGGLPGEVYILIMRGSRDEAYYWSSRRKERKMLSQIQRLKEMLEGTPRRREKPKREIPPSGGSEGQATLDAWW